MTVFFTPNQIQHMLDAAEQGEPIRVVLTTVDDPEAPTIQDMQAGTDITEAVRFYPVVDREPFRREYLNEWAPADCEVVDDDAPDHPDRVPSGEHTSADTDDVVGRIEAAIEDWEIEGDAAAWRADGSHEHDPPWWTRQDMGGGHYRPGSTACMPWESGTIDTDHHLPAFTWTFRDEPPVQVDFSDLRRTLSPQFTVANNARVRQIFGDFIDGLTEISEAARRVVVQLGRNMGREAVLRVLRERRSYTPADQWWVQTRRMYEGVHSPWGEPTEPPPPHADLEPLNLPRIDPGDQVVVRWNDGGTLEFTIAEHERRTRPNWPGAQR